MHHAFWHWSPASPSTDAIQWDGQHVMRRLVLLEGGLVSADSRCDWSLLDGLLFQEFWENRRIVS